MPCRGLRDWRGPYLTIKKHTSRSEQIERRPFSRHKSLMLLEPIVRTLAAAIADYLKHKLILQKSINGEPQER